MHPEALILRRCYPVPVTFADRRQAYLAMPENLIAISVHHVEHLAKHGTWPKCRPSAKQVVEMRGSMDKVAADTRRMYVAALKQVTGALDEVYAVVDGREVRVAVVPAHGMIVRFIEGGIMESIIRNLLEVADEQGYWERPHEVRLDLSPRPVSHGEVALAVLVGQEYVERHGH
jgi:hypothetical protein